MIIGKQPKQKGVTIQVKVQGTPGTDNLTVHGFTQKEVYEYIHVLFKSLEEVNDDVEIKFYKTKKRMEGEVDDGVQATN